MSWDLYYKFVRLAEVGFLDWMLSLCYLGHMGFDILFGGEGSKMPCL